MPPAPRFALRARFLSLICTLLLCAVLDGCGASSGPGASSAALDTTRPVAIEGLSQGASKDASSSASAASAAPSSAPRPGSVMAAPVTVSAKAATPTAVFTVSSDWGSGFTASVRVTNPQSTPVASWRLEFDFDRSISAIWDARIVSHVGTHYVIAGNAWNADIPAGGSVSFGFNGAPGGVTSGPTGYLLNGVALGSDPAPSPSPTTSPSPSPTVSPSPTPSPSPSGPVTSNGAQIAYKTTSDWGSGFGGSVTITNKGTTALRDWSLSFDWDRRIDSIWNVRIVSRSGSRVTVQPESWMTEIAAGQTVSFGFNGSPGNVTAGPSSWTFSTSTTTPAPSPTPTPTPSPTPTPTPTPLPSPTPSATPTPSPTPTPISGLPARKRIAYFTEWSIYERAYYPMGIPAASLDVVNYAFANVSSTGEVVIYDSWAATDKAFPGDTWDQPLKGNFNQLIKLKQQYPHLRTMISVGGWTLSGRFSDVALTAASRQTFAQSAARFASRYGFDGVDIDWEYPVGGGLSTNVTRPDDKHNYTLLLQALRAALDAQGTLDGKRYLLSIAAPAGASTYSHIELAAVAGVIDWFNLMTYDFHGGWDPFTGHHCPLYANPADPSDPSFNVAATVQGYRAAGVPAAKLVVGIGSYGRSWKGVPSKANGLFQSASGVPRGTWDDTGVFDYCDLVNRLATGTTWVRSWDDAAKVPWLYAASLDGGTFVTYDDAQGVALKTDYVVTQGLGGVMMWELSSDVRDVTDPRSLLRTVNQHLSP